MRAWVLWKMLKRDGPRVAAGRAGWPPRMRARLCPPRVGPPPAPHFPASRGEGGLAHKSTARLFRRGLLKSIIWGSYGRIVLSSAFLKSTIGELYFRMRGGAQKHDLGLLFRALGRDGRGPRRPALPASYGAMRPNVHPKIHSKDPLAHRTFSPPA